MANPRRITIVQAATILINTIIGVGVLRLPLIAVQAGDTGAPLVTLLAVSLAFIGLWVITKLGMRFPRQSIIEYSETIFGKWISRIYIAVVIVFFITITGFASREFGEIVISAILKETPLEVVVILMLFIAAIYVRYGLDVFAYIQFFYVPAILAPGLIIVVLSLKNANPIYLQPILGNGSNEMIGGVMAIAALFQGAFILTLIIPAMQKPQEAMKVTIWGSSISGGFFIIIVIAALSVFGPEELKNLSWPTFELARMTSLPGNILQRLDVIFLAAWVTAVFTTIFSNYMFTIQALSLFFHLRDHKVFSVFLLPIIFVVAMLPENVLQMYKVIELIGKWSLLITIGFPILLFMTAKIRNIHAKKEGD